MGGMPSTRRRRPPLETWGGWGSHTCLTALRRTDHHRTYEVVFVRLRAGRASSRALDELRSPEEFLSLAPAGLLLLHHRRRRDGRPGRRRPGSVRRRVLYVLP